MLSSDFAKKFCRDEQRQKELNALQLKKTNPYDEILGNSETINKATICCKKLTIQPDKKKKNTDDKGYGGFMETQKSVTWDTQAHE